MYVISEAPAAAQFSVTTPAAGINAFNVIAGEPGAGAQLNLGLQGSNRLNGQPFTVRAAGYVTIAAGTYTTGTSPIQFCLHASTTAGYTVASGTQIWSAVVAAFTWTSATGKSIPWEIEVELSGDTTDGRIVGAGQGLVSDPNNVLTAVARTVIANQLSSINFATEPPMQFAVSVNFGTSPNITGPVTANLTQLLIEA